MPRWKGGIHFVAGRIWLKFDDDICVQFVEVGIKGHQTVWLAIMLQLITPHHKPCTQRAQQALHYPRPVKAWPYRGLWQRALGGQGGEWGQREGNPGRGNAWKKLLEYDETMKGRHVWNKEDRPGRGYISLYTWQLSASCHHQTPQSLSTCPCCMQWTPPMHAMLCSCGMRANWALPYIPLSGDHAPL